MLCDIVSVRVVEHFVLEIVFEDGRCGTVDVRSQVPLEGVFAPLRDPGFFAKVHVDPEIGTIVWPNGADLAPDVLYAVVGVPVGTT